MKGKILKIVLIIIVPIVLLVIAYIGLRVFKKIKPGLYFKFECDQTGDNSVKFYGDNWKARGFVCDGGYIPFGVSLKKQSVDKVLEKMAELNNGQVPTTNSEMKELAKRAVTELTK